MGCRDVIPVCDYVVLMARYVEDFKFALYVASDEGLHYAM